jgi:hypothetical protein
MLHEAFGEHSLSWTVVFEWHSHFKVGWRLWTFRATKHHQNDRNVEKIRELIHKDCRRTIHQLADTVGITYGVCQEILSDNLNTRHVASKFVPWLLTNNQKQRHINVYLELREKSNKDPTFISRIIKVGQSWIYGYDPETKQQSLQWKSLQSSRAK